VSPADAMHGVSRRKSDYSAAMLVEESQILRGTIFKTLQSNLVNIDPSLLLIGLMTIAEEVDSQLSQAMASASQQIRSPVRPRLGVAPLWQLVELAAQQNERAPITLRHCNRSHDCHTLPPLPGLTT
jgi:hypothetical protein